MAAMASPNAPIVVLSNLEKIHDRYDNNRANRTRSWARCRQMQRSDIDIG